MSMKSFSKTLICDSDRYYTIDTGRTYETLYNYVPAHKPQNITH